MSATVRDLRVWLERMPDEAEVLLVTTKGTAPLVTVGATEIEEGRFLKVMLMTHGTSPKSVAS